MFIYIFKSESKLGRLNICCKALENTKKNTIRSGKLVNTKHKIIGKGFQGRFDQISSNVTYTYTYTCLFHILSIVIKLKDPSSVIYIHVEG